VRYVPLTKWHRRDRKVNENGYVLVYVPEHPKSFCGGWYYEHRLFAERKLGQVLPSWITVHHISGDKTDNSEANLFFCSRAEHDRADARLTLKVA